MINIDFLIEQVRQVLFETNDNLSPHEMHSRFVNECGQLLLSEDDFYKKVLKVAHKRVDWAALEEQHIRVQKAQQNSREEVEENEEANNAAEYIDRLINHSFEEGRVTADMLKNIFDKTTLSNQKINALALRIDEKLKEGNYKPSSQVNLDAITLKEILLSTDWYKSEDSEKLRNKPSQKNGRKINLWFLLPIIILIAWFLLLWTSFFEKNDCYLCTTGFKFDIAFLFNGAIIIILLLTLSLCLLPHFAKRLKKPPLFLWILYALIGISGILVSIFFGFHTDKLIKYDSDSHNDNAYWFWPSNLIKFPLQQIQLSREPSSDNILDTIQLDYSKQKKEAKGLPIIHLIIVDRTGSGNENSFFKNLSRSQKEQIQLFLTDIYGQQKSDTNCLDSISLRDYIAATICHKIEQHSSDSSGIHSTATFVYDGLGGLKPVNKEIIISLANGSTAPEHAKKYFDSCLAWNRKKTEDSKDTSRTNFAELFRGVANAINTKVIMTSGKRSHILKIYLISDFFHEVQYPSREPISFFQVDSALSMLSSNKNWQSTEMYLYKFPLFSYQSERKDTIQELLSLIERHFDRSYLYEYNIQAIISKNLEILAPSNFVAYDNANLSSIRFYYSNKALGESTQANFRVCMQKLNSPNVKDKLILKLTKNGLKSKDDIFKYDYFVSRSNEVIADSSSYTEDNITIDSILNCDKIRIVFNVKHINKIMSPLYLEIYSENRKSKSRRLVEFCEILPNSTTYYLIILYTIFIFSLLYISIMPFHFLFFRFCLMKKCFSKFYSNFVSLFLITSTFISLFFATYFRYISSYNLGLHLTICLILIAGTITTVAHFHYRYYYSKFLFAQHKAKYEELIKKPKFFARRNRCSEAEQTEDVIITKQKRVNYK